MSRQFKGASATQDARYTDKEKKLLTTLKFPLVYKEKVDIKKINIQVLRPWISNQISSYLGLEDDVVIEYVYSLLEENSLSALDPRRMQIQLTGFLEDNTVKFMIDLWKLLLSAQNSIGGIPQEFLDAKKEEIRKKMEHDNMLERELRNRSHRHSQGSRQRSRSRDRRRERSPIGKRERSPKRRYDRSPDIYSKRSRSRDTRVRSRDRRIRSKSRSRSRDRRSRSKSPLNKRSRSRSKSTSRSRDAKEHHGKSKDSEFHNRIESQRRNKYELSILNIPASTRVKNAMKDSSIQTNAYCMTDKEIQSVSLINEQTQTISANSSKGIASDIVSLTRFLKSVEPMVSRNLMANLKSRAFHGYSVSWEEDIDEISLLGICKVDSDDMAAITKFNISGSLIAVAFGCQNHDSWCSHKGKVCVWNIKSRDLDFNRPFFTTETLNCVQSLDFHPKIPGLLAVGTFNEGDITLFSVFQDTSVMTASSIHGDKSHSEPISTIIWKKSLLDSSYELLSIANDGKILVWNDGLKDPLRGCLLTLAGSRSDVVLGGTAMAVSKHNSNDLYIGTETGYLFKVGMNKMAPVNENGTLVSNCIIFSYESHIGQITSLDQSPAYRNALASASTDGTVRLYSTLQTKPLHILEPCLVPLSAVSWSPSRPCVLAIGSINGYIYLYDLKRDQSIPFVSFLAVSRKGASIVSINFNNNGQQIAVSDSLGRVVLWQLSTFLSKSQQGEHQALEKLFDQS